MTRVRDEAHPVVRRGVRQQDVGETDRLEHTQRFIVEADRARIVDDLLELFHQHHAHALQPQIVRDHQTDGPGTDNCHVSGHGFAAAARGRRIVGWEHTVSFLTSGTARRRFR